MRVISKLGSPTMHFPEWFSCGDQTEPPFCFQDDIHISTKLRNIFLKTNFDKKRLPFGSFQIKVEHLYALIRICTKDKHLLTPSTLNPIDKQNFESVNKMCSPLVIKCLRKYVS